MTPKRTPKRNPSKKAIAGKLSVQLFRPKKVSFTRSTEENESDFEELEEAPSPNIRGTAATTTRTPSAGKRKIPVTPHPSSSKRVKMSKDTSSLQNKNNTGAKNETKGRRQRRKTKRLSFSSFSFSGTGTAKTRPNTTLTAQLSYLLESLPLKISALKKETKICHAVRIQELGTLEENLLKRMELVSNLKVNKTDDDIIDKKYEVIEEMQDKILEVQNLKGSKQRKLEEERPDLRANHNKRYVCCSYCAKTGNV